MSRLNSLGSNVTGRTAELFAAIESRLGEVPNAYDAIGSNSPVALEALLDFDAKLAVSEVNGCDYCLAAHTLAGKAAGLPADAILAARRGTVPQPAVDAFRAAGCTDAQVVHTIFAITSITFTNLLNRIDDTAVDFPKAPA
jgi:AhpD family alkylhydroperoxidase